MFLIFCGDYILLLFGLCGFSGVGKSTIVQILDSELNLVQVISTGNVIRDLLKKNGLELNHPNLQKFNKQLHSKLKENYISIIYPFFNKDVQYLIVDSLRTVADYEKLTKDFVNFHLVGVSATEQVRFNRIITRGRETDPKSEKDFFDLTRQEKLWGVNELLSKADIVINNNGTFLELKNQTLKKIKDL